MTAMERQLRSFVRRQGRITPAQKRAFDIHWMRYGLEYEGPPKARLAEALVASGDDGEARGVVARGRRGEREWRAVFGRWGRLSLEIGFGNGDQLLQAAIDSPEADWLGVEVHRPGVGRLLNGAAAANIDNLRVWCHDAIEVLRDEIADDTLDQVRLWFPDPWPKTRQRKRRLVQPEFVALVARKLKPGGLLHMATDWQDYAEQMLAVADACAALRNAAGTGQYSPCPSWRQETHFERRGRRLGHGVWDLLHERPR